MANCFTSSLMVREAWRRSLLASALAQLDVERAMVVSGADGLGELTLTGPTHVSEVIGKQVTEKQFTPTDFGLPESELDGVCVQDPAESAAIVQRVLSGEHGTARDIVILIAAAGLLVFQRDSDPKAAAERAAAAIDSQAAADILQKLAQTSHAPLPS